MLESTARALHLITQTEILTKALHSTNAAKNDMCKEANAARQLSFVQFKEGLKDGSILKPQAAVNKQLTA